MQCLNAPPTESGFLRRKPAGQFLDVSPATLDKWHRAGKGPIRVTLPDSRIPVYALDELSRWVSKGKGQSK
jgi:hypothetical protein